MAADQSLQNFEQPEMLKLPIKEVVADIFKSSATHQVINALNMPSSASHPDMDIYRWENLSMFPWFLGLLRLPVVSVPCQATIRLTLLLVLSTQTHLLLGIGAMVCRNGLLHCHAVPITLPIVMRMVSLHWSPSEKAKVGKMRKLPLSASAYSRWPWDFREILPPHIAFKR